MSSSTLTFHLIQLEKEADQEKEAFLCIYFLLNFYQFLI